MFKKIALIGVSFSILFCCLSLFSCNDKNTSVTQMVEFIANDKTYHTSEIKNGAVASFSMPADPIKVGFTFDGWFLDNGIWQQEFTAQNLLDYFSSSNSIQVYAKYSKTPCDILNKEHSFTVIEETNPTCSSSGYKVEKCIECEFTQTTTTKMLGHSYDVETTLPAKCKAEGVCTYRCTRNGCNFSYAYSIPALEHEYVDQITTSATCERKGIRTYSCTREGCGTFYTEIIPSIGHKYDSVITTPAKCEREGIRTHFCTRDGCSVSYTTYIPALKHEYDSKITTPPKCEVDGVRTYFCTQEGCTDSYTESIDKLHHSQTFEIEITIMPCVKPGLKTYSCKRDTCDYTYTEAIEALGYHDCNSIGSCTRCNAENVCSKLLLFDGDTLTGYNGNDANIVIPSMFNGVEIKSIYSLAFYNNSTIETIYIPDTIESIGSFSLSCPKLKNVRMSSNVKSIDSYAFSYTAISTIYLPKTLINIGEATFYSCENLSVVNYQGTQADWHNINFEKNNNNLFSPSITYNYSYIRNENND